MYCVLADRLDCADALLKAGADVNKTDHSKRTALHLAAQKVRIKLPLRVMFGVVFHSWLIILCPKEMMRKIKI